MNIKVFALAAFVLAVVCPILQAGTDIQLKPGASGSVTIIYKPLVPTPPPTVPR